MRVFLPHSFSKNKHGFTLIETVVAIAVLMMFFGAVAYILQIILKNVGESRVRATALSVAQTKMELIRNLPYVSVGTVGGIPQGPIAQTENVVINNQTFVVTTSIQYVDDPFDGVAPTDLVNTDYKRARVEVNWGGTFPSTKPVTLVTNIVPKGIETVAGGGTLFIQVINSRGEVVPNATVKIDNTAVSPNIHVQSLTDSNGLLVLPGSPACNTCYSIEVTKTGYSKDKTYTAAEVTNPLQPLVSVLEGRVSNLSFSIDQVSSINIYSYGSKESGYPQISGVMFTLKGSKIIGYDVNDMPVLKYTYSTNTGGGLVNIGNLEWDNYSLDFSNSGHNLAGSNPISPFPLNPNTNLNIAISAVPKTTNSLLVAVKNSAQELQASASVTLKNNSGINIMKTTAATSAADYGQVFYGGLNSGNYNLVATVSGYQVATASVSVSGIKQETLLVNLGQ